MKGALKWTVGLVVQNIGWKLLALAIAFALWAIVASEPELATFETVRLEYKNLPEELELASEPASLVTLELRGPSGELRGAGDRMRPAVVLDMTGAQPGVRTFPIGGSSVKLVRGVRLVRAIPSEVRFDFERRAVRNIKVTPRLVGVEQLGYAVERLEVVPAELPVAGPASHVERVREAVTDPVDISAVVGGSEFRVNAFLSDPYVRFLTSPQVAVTVTMRKK